MKISQKEYSIINLLRFLAAAWVLIFHAQIHFGPIDIMAPVEPIISQGVLAMSLFFILSGFILSYRYKDFTDARQVRDFFVSRIARLYPVYLFMGIVTIWTISNQLESFPVADEPGVGRLVWICLVVFMFLTATQAWFPSLFSVWNFGGSWSLSVEAFL